MTPIRRMIKGAFVYGVGDLLLFGISYLVMIPLLTRYLSPEEYGVVATLNTLSIFLLAFFQLGLPSAGFRYWFLQTTPTQQKSYMTSIMLTAMLVSGVIASAMLLLGQPVWDACVERAPFTQFAPYIVIGAALQVIIAFKSVLLRALDRPRLFITLDICQFLFMLGSVAYQVVVLRNGVLGQIQGVLYTQAVFAVISLLIVVSICGVRVHSDGLLTSLRFAWPAMISSIVSLVATRSTILFTQPFVTGAAVGLFALGSQIGSLVQMAATSLEKAWQPFLYSRDPESARTSLRSLLGMATPAYTLIAVVLALFSPEIIDILAAPEYAGASIIASIALFGALCMALSSIANGGLYYTTKSGLSLVVTFISAGANVLLCWYLIPRYGIIGAAVATAIAGLVSLTLMLASVRAVFDGHLQYYRLFNTILLGLALSWIAGGVLMSLPEISAVARWGIKMAVIGTYLSVIWKLRWYSLAGPAFHPDADTRLQTTPSGIVEAERR